MHSITDNTVRVNARPEIKFFFVQSDEAERTIPVFVAGELRAIIVLSPEPERDQVIPFDGRPLSRERVLDAGDDYGLDRGEF